MDMRALTFCILAGIFFGGWPLAMRASGFNPFAAGFVLNLGSALIFLPFLKGKINPVTLLSMGAIFALAASALNGVGHIAFQTLVAQREIEISRVNTVLVMVVVLTTTVGGRIFYGEPFTWKKILGLVAALTAVKLLTGK